MVTASVSDYVDFEQWNTPDYMAASCCCVNLFIFLPMISIYAFKYSKRRNDSKYIKYFQTRNLNLIRFWLICNFYYISIHVTLLCFIQFYYKAAEWVEYFSDFCIISFLFCLFALRHWILYFDYMWSMSQLDLIWKRQINKQYSNWYISHQRLGNTKFCFFAILVPLYIVLNVSL